MKSLIFSAILLSIFFQNDDLTKSMAKGKDVYTDFCVTCHKPDGTGTPKFFPPLAKADYLTQNRADAIRSVKLGQKGKITVNGIEYNGMMPNPGLSDEEVVDVMNYSLNIWGNKSKKMVTLEEVKSIK